VLWQARASGMPDCGWLGHVHFSLLHLPARPRESSVGQTDGMSHLGSQIPLAAIIAGEIIAHLRIAVPILRIPIYTV
jgi:hypothetical protein